MTSRQHYVRKHNALLYKNYSLLRGSNVPDELLTPEQLKLRRELESLRLRIAEMDKRSE